LTPTLDAKLIARLTGHQPVNLALFEQALTHGSTGRAADYQRLEFIGDRVLGLVIAEALFDRFPDESEGELSRRLNVLVSRESCAELARGIGLPEHIRLGKQARDDGGRFSDNIIGDAMEALIGALFRDGGLDAARAFIAAQWDAMISGQATAPKHPKSALQEWAAAAGRRPPEYETIAREGPPHAPRFRVSVTLGKLASAEAEGPSKHAAETAAAQMLLDQLKDLKS
jgi:ribonuclease-3